MANLPEAATWEAGIYQLEITDPVRGGAEGISNLQAKQLANRTAWLKDGLSTGAVDGAHISADSSQASGVTYIAPHQTLAFWLNA